ncbi:unnamed protein product [Caenorhabditis nigoni]
MEPKPMVFCDMKTVLTYMEASCRFKLALKIPSIRKAEKAAPLIINRLEIHENRLIVNDTEYRMAVYRQCQADAGLYNGEVDDDSDEFGFKISIDESMQPGDIKLTHSGNMHRRREFTQEELEYDCPEKMSSIPCNHYIRLYVFGSMSQFPYKNMKMYQLIKRLLTIFLGNRNEASTIKSMIVKDNVLRWPVNLQKPIVPNIEIGQYYPLKLDALQSIIDSTVPLTSLKVGSPRYLVRISDHPFLRNVEHLIISNYPSYDFLSDLLSIQTTTVSTTLPISREFNLYHLIYSLIRKTRPIGVCFSIPVNFKEDLDKIIDEDLRTIDGVLEKSRNRIKLSVGRDVVAFIQYTRRDSKNWLEIKTVPKEE